MNSIARFFKCKSVCLFVCLAIPMVLMVFLWLFTQVSLLVFVALSSGERGQSCEKKTYYLLYIFMVL